MNSTMTLLRSLSRDAAENSIMQTITIAVSAILIAAGLVTAPGLINNARDNNAKTDLANVAYAQEFYLADQGRYAASIAEIRVLYSGNATTVVASTGPVLTMSGGVEFAMNVSASGDAYLMAALSESGKTFYRSSGSANTSAVIGDIETHGLAVPVPGDGGNDGGNGGGIGAGAVIAACTPHSPALPGSGVEVGNFTTTASIAVCDSQGLLYAGTSNGSAQTHVHGVNHYNLTSDGETIGVIVRIRHEFTVDVEQYWRIDGLQLSDGSGGVIALDCDTATPTGALTDGQAFEATCTAEFPIELNLNSQFWNVNLSHAWGMTPDAIDNPVLGQFGLQGVGVYAAP